ncbi:hypothetical protein [Chromobacterium sphagni]|uniref:TonB C-terminal domain-containing protein n=1 Tax=Chromobacterium sphagni TaxID=1903179 RepID=A0A1S1X3X8_9NEIS|nr:hypothetical protein [Chromobacterium sphagni]OHX13946.1 hypothetical protein BI347_10825 [Chromobacterium sphagni]OHX20153.1 hypothetical protein BI344_06510 [Chromobacterium sphagni]
MRKAIWLAGLLAAGMAAGAAATGCAHQEAPDYPLKALRDEVGGVVKVRFHTRGDGTVAGIESAEFRQIPPQYRSGFRSEINKALREYRCAPDVSLTQEFAFRTEDE